MSFQISGSQESIASNGAQFGVETKKLWLFDNDCAHHERKWRSRTPIGHILEHLMELKLFILYLVSNLRKSRVQISKRCSIWSWNEEVMPIWRWLCKAERKCYSCTPFFYCWTRFWSTLWSSNYVYHMSFWSLGSQESSALNGVRFGFETKKLWPFEDKPRKAKAGIFFISQLRNHPLAHERHFAAPVHPFRSCKMGCENSHPPWNPPPVVKMLQA